MSKMAGKYLMGIDEGTMSSRACIFDLEGEMLGSSAAEYSVTSPKPGWYEQDCEVMSAVINDVCQGAIKQADINPAEIGAIGLSSQGAAFVPVNEKNQIIRPCIGWQDTRGALVFDEMAAAISADEYYRISGMPICTTPWSISKIMWLRKYEPQNYERAAAFALHQDYFLTALGVEGHFADISSASRYGIFDVDHHDYSDRLLQALDIPKNKLATIVPGGTCVGNVTNAVADLTGLAVGTSICVGAMDVNASLLGLGVVHAGMAGTILGTYGTCIAFSPKPVRDPNGSMVVMGNVGTNKWTIEGSSLAAASSFRWFRDTFGEMESALGKLMGQSAFEIIDTQIAGGEPGAHGLLFLPHLASAGAPRNNENARGVLLGISLAHSKADVARAIMEGICLEIRDIIEAEGRAGIDIQQIRITGGGTKSAVWNQIQADVYGKQVQTVQTSETGSLGAAMLAGIGAGAFKNLDEAVEAMVHVTSTYDPNPAAIGVYDDLYAAYTSAYECLAASNVYNRMASLQNRLGL